MTLHSAPRIALREMRGGLAGFRIFLICLALGVAAIAAVGTVRHAIERGLEQEASAILGGDAEMEFTYRFATGEERAWISQNSELVSELVDFRSMAGFTPDDGPTERSLVQVKAIDNVYPLYGNLELEEGTLDQALEISGGRPGLVAEAILADRLNLVPGDVLTLGEKEFRFAGRIISEPDAAASGFSFGPRVIVRLADLDGSGLLGEGALFNSSYRLKIAPHVSLSALKSSALDQFGETGLQWTDRTNGTPGVSRFVERLGSFLVLLGLAGLVVGGIGVSAAVHGYLAGRAETIATLKTLGATGGTIFGIYFIQIGILSAVGIATGLIAGAGIPLLLAPLISDLLPFPAVFEPDPASLAQAAVYGTLTALIFTIWPLSRARQIRAAELFRDNISGRRNLPEFRYILTTLALACIFVATAAYFSGAVRLTLSMAVGILGAMFLLFLAASGLKMIARRFARAGLTKGRPALRWALAVLGGPSGETASVALSLGLGLSVLATIGQIDSNLRSVILDEIPERAPSYFVVDIQNNQLEGFLNSGRAIQGVNTIETAPMMRGILTRINGVPAREVAGEHWTLNGDRGLTYAAEPAASTVLAEGEWWPSDYTGDPLVSFAEEEALELGLTLGDRITVNILGRDITATISNLRQVEFSTMGINFVMVFNSAALESAPHTHIATIYAEQDAEAPFVRILAGEYPNITAIGVRQAINRVAEALESIGSATRWGAAAILLIGLTVLIGAAAAGERARIYEAAVLKTLGASRARILRSFAIRSALIGMSAGIVAVGAGAVSGWWVMTRIMDTSFSFSLVSALGIVGGGALVSLLAGLFFALRPLAAKPARILRTRE